MNEDATYKHNVECLVDASGRTRERIERLEEKVDKLLHIIEVVASYPLTEGQFSYIYKLIEKVKKE